MANQSQNLAALMKNYGTAIDATNTALHSNNSASKENEKYRKSLKGSLADLSSAWEDFSRKMVNSKAVTGVLHGLTGIVHGLSSDFGQAAIKFGAFALAGAGIVKIVPKISAGFKAIQGLHLIGTFQALGSSSAAFIKAGGEINGVNGGLFRSFAKLTGALNPITLGFAGIVASLSAGVVIYGKWLEKNDAFVKQNERAVKAEKEYQQAQKDVEATKQRISDIQSEIDALESKRESDGLTIKEEERLSLLKEQYEVQKKQLELEKEIERNKFEKSQTTLGKKGLTTNDFTKYRGKTPDEIWSAKGVENKTDKALYMYNQSMSKSIELREKAIQAQNKYDKALTEEGHTTEELNKLAKKAKNAQSEYSESLGDSNKTLSDLLDEKQKYIDLYGDESKIPKELRGSYKNLNKVIEDNIALGEVSVDNVKDSIKAIKKYGNAMGVTTEKMEDGSTKINRIDFNKFSGALKNAGKGGDEVLDMLQEIGKQNPNAKVTIEGTDYAMSDLRVVDGELQTIDGKVVTSVAAINDQASPQLAKVSKEKNLGTATKKIEQKGYGNVKRKLDNLRGNHDLGTDTKTIVTVKETRHKRRNEEKHGTRNFYAKGTDDSAIGNAVVNEQGFEIIRDGRTGAMRVANAGQRGSTWLNRGDAVYTHGQSMRMLQRAGLTEADLLQGRNGDVGVFGVSRLEGFAKGKKQTKYNKARDALRAKYDAAVETAEFKQERYGYSDDWLHAQMQKARATYLKRLKKLNKKYSGVKKATGLGTDREREYILSGVYQTSAEKAVEGIEDALAGFEGGDVKYDDVLAKIKEAREKKLISSQEYKEYLAQLKEVYDEEKKEAISKNIELVANNRKTYDDILAQIKKTYEEGGMSAKEYAEFVEELNEAEVERVRNNYENQWDYISQYVQRQIDLEQKNNDVLEAQGELLSATTQKVKVYKEGVGFVYEADERAVKEAQDNLKSYSSVWEQISEIMDDVESQVNLQRAGVLAGDSLVAEVLGAGTNLSTWQNIIGLIGSNVGAYGLADDLNITDPSKINKATTINGQTFNIDNISLPNVSNADDFVNSLQTLAIQASSSRS